MNLGTENYLQWFASLPRTESPRALTHAELTQLQAFHPSTRFRIVSASVWRDELHTEVAIAVKSKAGGKKL